MVIRGFEDCEWVCFAHCGSIFKVKMKELVKKPADLFVLLELLYKKGRRQFFTILSFFASFLRFKLSDIRQVPYPSRPWMWSHQ